MSQVRQKIPKPIQEELRRRQLITSRAVKTLPMPGAGKDVEFADYTSKSHYAIMCTDFYNTNGEPMPENNYAISSGEFGRGANKQGNWGFKGDGTGAYRNTEVGSAVGIRPVAGIKSISSEYRGSGGYNFMRNTTISWVAPTLESLEEFAAFLTQGEPIAVQWGFVGATTTLDAEETFITIHSNAINVKPDIRTNPRERILRANGNMDGVAGDVKSFSFKLRDDGGFDCTTDIVSTGHNMFSKDINSDDAVTLGAVLSKETENKLEDYANGLVPNDAIGIVDEAKNTITDAVTSFIPPNDSSQIPLEVEDHLLNGMLNLDNIVMAHMESNKFDTIDDDLNWNYEHNPEADPESFVNSDEYDTMFEEPPF